MLEAVTLLPNTGADAFSGSVLGPKILPLWARGALEIEERDVGSRIPRYGRTSLPYPRTPM